VRSAISFNHSSLYGDCNMNCSGLSRPCLLLDRTLMARQLRTQMVTTAKEGRDTPIILLETLMQLEVLSSMLSDEL
jgi:hypothetical protein